MIRHNTAWKRAFIALFLYFTTSCSNCGSLWQCEESIAALPSMSSSRVYLAPANEFSGLELEFVLTMNELRLYINVFGLEVPTDNVEQGTTNVYISFRDCSYTFPAKRFLGGQRLLVPEPTLYDIVHYLEEGQPVFIQVGRYQADIYPQNFIPVYNRMVSVFYTETY